MRGIYNGHDSVINGNSFARQTNDPLDKIETGIERVFKNDDVSALGVLKIITYLVDDEILTVLEG